jgi:hypothetical protein
MQMVWLSHFYDYYYGVNPADSTFVNKYKFNDISIDVTNNYISHYTNVIFVCVIFYNGIVWMSSAFELNE